MPTLDIEQHQVLVDFPNDAHGYIWHHRILWCPVGGSVWIWATPDESVQRGDLSAHRVIVLRRNSAFPAGRLAQTYAFDDAAFDDGVLNRLMEEARGLAAVHGAPPPGIGSAGGDTWRISDTSHPSFGELVPSGVVGNDELFVVRDSTFLVKVEQKWTTASKLTAGESETDFKRRFHSGPGRDRRILADQRDPDGRRFLALAAILPLLLEINWPQWPIAGPRNVREFLLAVRAAGHTALLEYHNE